ncbi:MAG: adenosine deaminase family protein [Myxococcota bacterium]
MTGPSTSLAELHLHLDGSLRMSTVRELAARLGVPVPGNLLFHRGMGLTDALSRFAFTLSLLQQPAEVKRVAAELCEDAARDGVTTLEVRFAPQLHRGAPPEAIIDAALEGLAGRAGLILCGLYGEPPEVLEHLVTCAASRPGVVGIDLAGGPAPTHSFHLADYARAFTRARDSGLGRTVHAAEGRPPAEIRVAVEALHAQRIGHGTTLLDDEDIVDLVLRRGVTLEACPTSNVHTGVCGLAPGTSDVAAHPLPRWLERGVRACVCADNTLLSDVSTAQEYERAARIPGMTPELLARAVANGHAAAFHRR